MQNIRTAIITKDTLPDDISASYTEADELEEVWVRLGQGYACLRRVDMQTAINASTMTGPIEDHLESFDVVSQV